MSCISNARWHLWAHQLSKFRHVQSLSLAGGGLKSVQRQVKMNKLTVRNRIRLIVDDFNDFFELSLCAGYDLPYVGTIPAAGMCTGIGKIAGQDCMFIAQDSTVKAGATYPISLKKGLRATKIAIDNHLPVVSLVDSAGAFLPLQSEIFPDENHGGKTFYLQARHPAPQISVILGHCTAGGAYTPMMTDQTIIVEGQGAVFLGGPPLVKAALGTIVTTEELGGAKLHTTVSGCTDHRAKDEHEAMKMVRNIFQVGLPKGDANYRCVDSFATSRGNLDDIENLMDENGLFKPMDVLNSLLDQNFYEFKPEYGNGVTTVIGSIKSFPVACAITNGTNIANDLDSLSKLAHFTQICAAQKTPIIFILNSQLKMSNSTNCPAAISAAARLTSIISTCGVPRVNLILGDSNYDDIFFSSGLQPDFIFTWPSARYLQSSLQAEEDSPERAKHDAVYGTARLWDDGILLPKNTRSALARVLSIFKERENRKTVYSNYFWPQAPFRHYAQL